MAKNRVADYNNVMEGGIFQAWSVVLFRELREVPYGNVMGSVIPDDNRARASHWVW